MADLTDDELRAQEDLSSFRVIDLKALLKTRNLSQTGRKAELVDRLAEHLGGLAEVSAEESPEDSAAEDGSQEQPPPQKKSVGQEQEAEPEADLTAANKAAADDSQMVDDAQEGDLKEEGEEVEDEDDEPHQQQQQQQSQQQSPSPEASRKRRRENSDDERSSPQPEQESPKSSPKEAVVPAGKKSDGGSTRIRIDGFQRPLNQKRLEEWLAGFGSVQAFWINSIKSHCLVEYATTAEADVAQSSTNGARFPDPDRQPLTSKFTNQSMWDATVRQQERPLQKQQQPQQQAAATKSTKPHTDEVQQPQAKKLKVVPVSPLEAPASQPFALDAQRVGPEVRLNIQSLDGFRKEGEEAEQPRQRENLMQVLDSNFRKTTAEPHLYWLPAQSNPPQRQQHQHPQFPGRGRPGRR